MNRFRFFIALGIVGLTSIASATPITVQPNEADSKDVFVYQGLNTTNFNSFGPFGALLGIGKTGTGHDIESLIQFDLTGVVLTPGETASIRIWVGDVTVTGFARANPSVAHPIILDVYANTSDWSETAVTWSSGRPTIEASPITSVTLSGFNQFVNFDVTSQLSSWLATPASNFGVTFVQRAIVLDGGNKIATVFDSAAGANAPSLVVVPEPAAMGLLAVPALLALRRRKSA